MSIKKISSEVIHQNPWWVYYHDTFEKSDGSRGDYYYGANPGFGFSMVVPFMDDGRLLLVRQFRYLKEKYSIQFPGGGIDAGETPHEAATRELKEEGGSEAGELVSVGSFESCSGLLKDEGHIFIGKNIQKIEGQIDEPTGATEVLYRRPDEFEDMINRGEIWDGQTLAAWLLARRYIVK